MKHAYLIIAHNNFYILEKLIMLLDDQRNDIYIHIDKKVKNFDFDKFENIAKKSTVFFTNRLSVNWGGFSQIKCELLMLKAATKGNYDYYHLLSGVDLPIKTQDYIHDFFDKNSGCEFVHFAGGNILENNNIFWRVSFYHLFQEFLRDKNKFIRRICNIFNNQSLKIQEALKVNRLKDFDQKLQHGCNWFSITHKLALYVLQKENWINKTFKASCCADEVFLQTIVFGSPFVDRLYRKEMDNNYISCLRKIDWTRGNPYTFKIRDYKEIVESDFLFARKFDYKIDKEIIDKIFEFVNKEAAVR